MLRVIATIMAKILRKLPAEVEVPGPVSAPDTVHRADLSKYVAGYSTILPDNISKWREFRVSLNLLTKTWPTASIFQ
jgi:hypothetical protein